MSRNYRHQDLYNYLHHTKVVRGRRIWKVKYYLWCSWFDLGYDRMRKKQIQEKIIDRETKYILH